MTTLSKLHARHANVLGIPTCNLYIYCRRKQIKLDKTTHEQEIEDGDVLIAFAKVILFGFCVVI